MIKIEFNIRDLDYNGLIDKYLPHILQNMSGSAFGFLISGDKPAAVVKGILKSLPEAKKEQLLVELINSNAAAASEQLAQYVRSQGTSGTVSGIRAYQL